MNDITFLRSVVVVVAILTAICVNAVPIIYASSPWRSRLLGRLFMYQAAALAFAIDISVFFILLRPDIKIRYWISIIEMSLIAAANLSMALRMWRMQRPKNDKKGPKRVLFTNAVYNKLKFVALVLLPALSAAYFGLAQIWHFPNVPEVMGTIAVIDTLLGTLLGISTKTYNAGQLEQPKQYDGVISVEPGESGSQLRLRDINPRSLETKNELVLKVVPPSS